MIDHDFMTEKTIKIEANLITWISILGHVSHQLRAKSRGDSRPLAVCFALKLGDALVKSGAITREQYDAALEAESAAHGINKNERDLVATKPGDADSLIKFKVEFA